MKNFTVRFAQFSDKDSIFQLYKNVAKTIGGLAREADEITTNYIENNLQKSSEKGINLVIENPKNSSEIIAEIHCYQLEPKVFRHVLSELTIVVHTDFQGKGLGKLLFTELLTYVENQRSDILRIELIARESNQKAIQFYQKLGFQIEGKFHRRIDNKTPSLEADIPMAWFNKNFKYLRNIS